MQKLILLSIIVPIYSEENVINEFYSRIKLALSSLERKINYEIIFVNDGSKDRSLDLLKCLNSKDGSVKIINFSRNFGHQIAITAGLDYANGDAVVIIDGDLQDPPELIPEMLSKWVSGYKVVFAVRRKRKKEAIFKKAAAKIFYRILNLLSDINIPVDTGDFRLMDKSVVSVLREMREENRYVRGLAAWVGFSQIGIPYDRDPRYAGRRKYTIVKSLGLSLNGLTSFSEKPLVVLSFIGFFIVSISFIYAFWIGIIKIVNKGFIVHGWTALMIVIIFFGGVQLFSIGIVGQYIGRIYCEVKRRPLYIIQDYIG